MRGIYLALLQTLMFYVFNDHVLLYFVNRADTRDNDPYFTEFGDWYRLCCKFVFIDDFGRFLDDFGLIEIKYNVIEYFSQVTFLLIF